MKITFDIDDEIVAEYEGLAADVGESLSQIIEGDLRDSLAHRAKESCRRSFDFSEFNDVGLHHGTNPKGYVFFDRMDEAEFEAYCPADD